MAQGTADDRANRPIFDDAPSSDNDAYSGDDAPTLDMSKYPRPRGFPLARIFGLPPGSVETLVRQKLTGIQNRIGRAATAEETDVIVYDVLHQYKTLSYYPLVGILIAGWLANKSKKTYRFPFVQPNLEKFTPTAFPTKSGPLRGSQAQVAWHTARVASYMGASLFTTRLFFASYADAMSNVTLATDPRLAAIRKELRGLQNEDMRAKQRGAAQQPYPGRRSDQADDASPSGGMGVFDGSEDGQEEPSTAGSWSKIRSSSVSHTQQPQDRPFDALDDASPTGGQGTVDDSASSLASPTGSAWERLRRGANSAGGGAPRSTSAWSKRQSSNQEAQGGESTDGDSYSISKTEEERSYAREEAQREFDARVEQERRGGDFSRGTGDQKRW